MLTIFLSLTNPQTNLFDFEWSYVWFPVTYEQSMFALNFFLLEHMLYLGCISIKASLS